MTATVTPAPQSRRSRQMARDVLREDYAEHLLFKCAPYGILLVRKHHHFHACLHQGLKKGTLLHGHTLSSHPPPFSTQSAKMAPAVTCLETVFWGGWVCCVCFVWCSCPPPQPGFLKLEGTLPQGVPASQHFFFPRQQPPACGLPPVPVGLLK